MKSETIEVLDRDTKKDEAGRRLLTDEVWDEILQAYQNCGLTQREYSRRNGVNVNTFVAKLARWRNRHGDPQSKPDFYEVAPQSSAMPRQGTPGAIEVLLPGGAIVRGSDIETIAALLKCMDRNGN